MSTNHKIERNSFDTAIVTIWNKETDSESVSNFDILPSSIVINSDFEYGSLFEVDAELYFSQNPDCDFISLGSFVAFSNGGNSIYFDSSSFRSLDAFYKYFDVPKYDSLNGNACQYIDGTSLNVLGRTQIYTVSRSFFGLVADNVYTVLYDLVSQNGEKITAPEALVSLYIPAGSQP